MLDIMGGHILRLNVTGVLIFERLQLRETESQIIDAISKEFLVSKDVVQTDVTDFLRSLAHHGLVHTATSAHP